MAFQSARLPDIAISFGCNPPNKASPSLAPRLGVPGVGEHELGPSEGETRQYG